MKIEKRMLNHLRKAANKMEKTKPKEVRIHHERFSRKMKVHMELW